MFKNFNALILGLISDLQKEGGGFIKLSRLLAVTIPVLSILYCAWAWFNARGTVYLYYPPPCSLGVGLLAGSLILLPAALVLRKLHWGYAIISLLITGGFLCAGTFFAFLGSKQHLESARLDEHVYHLAWYTDDNGLTRYTLCECDNSGIFCSCGTFYRFWQLAPTEMVVDEAANEIHIFINDNLIYTHGAHPRCHTEESNCWVIK